MTIADRGAEEIMRELILKRYPDHGVLGEEFGVDNPDAEYQWVLDPIDGTKNFVAGSTHFGTLIALTKRDLTQEEPDAMQPVLGVINQPLRVIFWWARASERGSMIAWCGYAHVSGSRMRCC